MEIKVSCRLCYDVPVATAFIFQIEAAKADAQIINSEMLTLPPGAKFDTYCDPVTMTRKFRTVLGPGAVQVLYSASADVDGSEFDPDSVLEFDFIDLPLEYLEYLSPSRYCPSDTFTDFAHTTFGQHRRGHNGSPRFAIGFLRMSPIKAAAPGQTQRQRRCFTAEKGSVVTSLTSAYPSVARLVFQRDMPAFMQIV